MKRLTKTFLAVCSVLAFFSCKKNIESVDMSTTNKSAYSKTVKGDTIVHKLSVNGATNTILEVKGEFYISDDMLIPKERFDDLKNQVLSAANPRALIITNIGGTYESTWPNGIVYFSYPVVGTSKDGTNPLTATEAVTFKNNIDSAIANISNSTGIIFKERTNQISYLKYQKHYENNAWLGYYRDYANPVNIAGIERVNTIMHETLHALGIRHEHQRNDRDNFITVDTSQVKKEFQYTFAKNTDLIKYDDYEDFDFQSIMLYDSYLGVKSYYVPGTTTRRVSMKKLDGTLLIDEKPGLSAGDIAALRYLYPSIATGQYKIQSNNGNKYLYTNTIGSFMTDSSTVYPNNDKYEFVRTGNVYKIKPVQQLGKVLAINEAKNQIVLEDETNSINQQFRLHCKDDDLFSVIPVADKTLRLNFNTLNVSVEIKDYQTANQTIKLIKFQ